MGKAKAKVRATEYKIAFFASIKGSVAGQPEDPTELPANLIKAGNVWKSAGGTKAKKASQMTEVFRLTASALRCRFISSDTVADTEDVVKTDDVRCTDVVVDGVDSSAAVSLG